MLASWRWWAIGTVLMFGLPSLYAAEPGLKVGDTAKDFELPVLGGKTAKLSTLLQEGPVVLVVLRGYPGYQCPLCSTQFAGYIKQAQGFLDAKAKVVFIYPGPSDQLQAKAKEFVKGRDYPSHFQILLDPDYTFTKAYNLRWEAKNETAYPSTFVIQKNMQVSFAKVSQTHGGRVPATEVLQALNQK